MKIKALSAANRWRASRGRGGEALPDHGNVPRTLYLDLNEEGPVCGSFRLSHSNGIETGHLTRGWTLCAMATDDPAGIQAKAIHDTAQPLNLAMKLFRQFQGLELESSFWWTFARLIGHLRTTRNYASGAI